MYFLSSAFTCTALGVDMLIVYYLNMLLSYLSVAIIWEFRIFYVPIFSIETIKTFISF